MKKISLEKYKIIITILIFAFMPILTVLIICLKDGIHLNEIYLANSQWNDEILYYKIVESVAKYNKPLGYFGYNGSSAKVGHFGPWSPVLFVFYIGYAKIFGWSMIAPIQCNILLMTIALAIFSYLVRPTRRQTVFICLLYGTCTIVTRYILSVMPEITIFALLIVFLGFSVKVYRASETTLKVTHIIALDIIAFLLVLMRPYWLLLFIVPCCFCWKRTKKNILFFIEAALAAISIVIYFLLTDNCCSPYFYELINTTWLELLFSSPLEGIYNILHIFISSVWNVLQSAGNGIIYGFVAGTVYALYLVIIGYLIYKTVGAPKKLKRVWGILTFSFCTMLLAIFFLYDMDVGYRHIIGFILIFALLLPLIEPSRKNLFYCLIAFACVFCIRATEEYAYSIPQFTDWKEAVLARGYESMIMNDMPDELTDNPWDNTIIWPMVDETRTDFTLLYALPEGMGINACHKDYILENFDELKPKYILTNVGEEIDLLCEKEEKYLVAFYGNVHIWRLR